MLNNDEDFTRKILGLMQRAQPNLLKIEVQGNALTITVNRKSQYQLTGAMFYKMTIEELCNYIGIQANDPIEL